MVIAHLTLTQMVYLAFGILIVCFTLIAIAATLDVRSHKRQYKKWRKEAEEDGVL